MATSGCLCLEQQCLFEVATDIFQSFVLIYPSI